METLQNLTFLGICDAIGYVIARPQEVL